MGEPPKHGDDAAPRLNEAEQTIDAIHNGHVDAIVVQGPDGPHIVMLQSVDEPYRMLVERMADGALTLAPDDTITYANRHLAKLLGVDADTLIGVGVASLFKGGIAPDFDKGTTEAELERNGNTIPVSVWLSPITVGAAAVKLVTITDLSVHHEVEKVVSAERFARSILEQANEAVLVLSPGGVITQASWIAEQLAAVNPVGRSFSAAFPIEIQSERDGPVLARYSPAEIDSLLASRPFHGVEVRMRAKINDKQERRSFLLSAGPLIDEDRLPVGAIVTLTDITERKRAEERQMVLVAELNHRVKNILAVVQAVAFQTLRTAPTLDNFKSTFAGRIKALSIAHDILTRTRWSGIGLNELLENVLGPHQFGDLPRISLSGPPVLLPARAVVPLSMALHELATNASKYGSLSVPQGTLDVAWTCSSDQDGHVNIAWNELGGPAVDVSSPTGFGTKGTSEQPVDHGTLRPLIRGGSRWPTN